MVLCVLVSGAAGVGHANTELNPEDLVLPFGALRPPQAQVTLPTLSLPTFC
jgi:hypothetical protein